MNILIVGEFSAFAKHLKNGFKQLNHEVTIVMRPDSFKKLHGDSNDILYGNNISICGKSIKGSALLLKPFRAAKIRYELSKRYHKNFPDVIVVINYRFITTSRLEPGVPLDYLKKQVRRGSKLIMLCCGGDPAYYYTYPDLLKIWGHEKHLNNLYDERFSWLLNNSHAIIPMAISYYESILNYSNYEKYDIKKVTHSIPPPMTIESNVVIKPCEQRKIVIFHGVVRPREKGTYYIEEAMRLLQADMPDKVECICKGGMPYDEYVKIFDNVDILVDQTYGEGFGMQSLIGAMKGKCVLVSNSQENMDDMGFKVNPFVRITPDVKQIYNALKDLVKDPQKIFLIKKSSRKFVEDYCDCKLIAHRYLEIVGLVN